jgi:hypothetical protein
VTEAKGGGEVELRRGATGRGEVKAEAGGTGKDDVRKTMKRVARFPYYGAGRNLVKREITHLAT